MNLRDLKLRARALFAPRRTAFVDDTVRDILYAFRTFRRAPSVAFTIVSTVALGLGLVAVVFTVLNVLLFRADAVRDVHEMVAVERPRTAGERAPFTRAHYDALRRETNVFTDAYAELTVDTRIDWRRMAGTLVTGNFFQVLGVRAALGRTLMPEDDERFAAQPVMVLSHRGWDRLFAGDPSVLGRRLLVNGFSYEVIGVMPEEFRGLAVAPPDFWAPLSLLSQFSNIDAGREDAVGLDIVGRLRPGMSRQMAIAGLAVWDAGQQTGGTIDRRSTNITLVPRLGTIPQSADALLVFSPLFFAFGLILMIGCANVANLLLGRAVSRQREVGIRLSLGASRRRLIRQLLTESLLLALAAAAAGFAISRVVLEAVINALMTSMPPDLGDIRMWVPGADWRVVLFLVGGAVVSTALFGLAPALQATRVEPVSIIRGEVIRDARPALVRNLLIGLQVSASALLLICSAVFLRSAFSAATVDLGLRTIDTVIVQIVNEPMRRATVQAVTAEPVVTAVAASSPDVPAAPRDAFAESNGRRSAVAYKFASPEYFSVLDIPVLRGRGFTAVERSTTAGVVVISEATARDLWPGTEAVGQLLQLNADPHAETRPAEEPPLNARTFSVVGVVRDVRGFRFFADVKEVGVYLPIDAATPGTSLIVRVHGNAEQARRTLLERLTAIDSNTNVVTMRTVARMEMYFLQIGFWSTLALGGLALVLTLSGLFSVLSYLVEQRRKEIGVRMALGADAHDVALMVLSQSIRPVGAGLVIGGSMAGALALVLRATSAASSIGEIVHVFDPVAYAASLVCIVTACALAAVIPAWRAARIDPINTLRQD